MRYKIKYPECFVVCILILFQTSLFGAVYTSPAAMIDDGDGHLYIADKTGRQLLEFSHAAREVTRVFALPIEPTGLAMVPFSGIVYITGGSDSGVVMALNLTSGTADVIPVGHTPMSPVLNGALLYTCNRFSNTVSVVDTSSNTQIDQIPVGREPVALALTPDGSRLITVHHLPQGPANDNDSGLTVSIIDTSTRSVIQTLFLYDGASGGRGVCISPDGTYAYITHLIGRYKLPTNQLERGWMWNNAISIIHIPSGQKVNTVLLDDIYAGAANPWAAACSADGAYLCVTHAGSMEVSIIDLPGLHQRLADVAAQISVPGGFSDSADDVPSDLGFLSGLRDRVQLIGNGPRCMILVGHQAYIGNYFSASIDTFSIADTNPQVVSYPVGFQETPSAARLGEQYFNDANVCYQKWLSCASCHPDGRSDALNWDLMNDGMGSPRNTKSMLLSHYTPPAMITGIRASAETAVNAGFKYIQFMSVPQERENAVNVYLQSERPVPSPYLVRGGYSQAAQRGRQTFFGQAQCSSCHQGDLYIDPSDPSNKALYDVGTNRPADSRPLDVPTLAEAWRTSPYLQNGAAATIYEVLTTCNPDDRHGHTSDLTQQELLDLQEFVLSIGKSLRTSDPILCDMTGPRQEADGRVNNFDLALIAYEWLNGTSALVGSPADIAGGLNARPDYQVDIADLMQLADQWLFAY